ncbi:hypothetical protein T484DRAFT_1824778, partial [Baffinella frigidus]
MEGPEPEHQGEEGGLKFDLRELPFAALLVALQGWAAGEGGAALLEEQNSWVGDAGGEGVGEEELEEARSEHRDINDLSDQLADSLGQTQPFGEVHAREQLSALKKRKLQLKDRVQVLERQIADAEDELRDEAEDEEEEEWDGEAQALGEMMDMLEAKGLRPEGVPPHKDSYFLALMLSLQRAGLRPLGYDFREAAVMGAERQFPLAAKRARADVLHLLAAQAHRLNKIGGWQLSRAEFARYFSQAWWAVPAAVNDLLMARGAHVISSAPLNPSASATVFAPPSEVDLASLASRVVEEEWRALPPPRVAPLTTEVEKRARRNEAVEEVRGMAGLEAGLGLWEEVVVEEAEGELAVLREDFEAVEEMRVEDSSEDEEVDEGVDGIDRL